MKENVIIGKLIPAGTGMKKYRSIDLDYGVNTALIEAYREMQREMEFEEEDDEDMGDVVPVMGSSDNQTVYVFINPSDKAVTVNADYAKGGKAIYTLGENGSVKADTVTVPASGAIFVEV